MRKRRSLEERFWEKVDIAGPDDCWEWSACRDKFGYGRVGFPGRSGTGRAYRIAYALTKGPIPDGYQIRHYVCNNPPCCNPKHLLLGTRGDNIGDMHTAGRYMNAPPIPQDPNRERWQAPPSFIEVACAYCGLISLVERYAANQGRHRYCSREHYQADARNRLVKRFWSNVDRRGPDECWEWKALLAPGGYGIIGIPSGGMMRVHRLAWELAHGEIPAGLIVRHFVCDNRVCCNVAHMRLGTRPENSQDMVRKGRQAKGKNTTWHLYPDALPKGEAHPNSKLLPEQVRAIRADYARGGISFKSLAERYGVSAGVIDRIVHRETWKHIE